MTSSRDQILGAYIFNFLLLILCGKYSASVGTKFAKIRRTATKLRNNCYVHVSSKIANFLDLCTNPMENVFSPKLHKKFIIIFLKSLQIIYFVLII